MLCQRLRINSTPSIRSLTELAKEKSKGSSLKDLSKMVTAIIPSVQPTGDLSSNISMSTDANVARDTFKDIISQLSKKKEIMCQCNFC